MHWALLIASMLGAKAIYDAHEDYPRQAFEYGGKTLRAAISAARILVSELIFCRLFPVMFCTDDFLWDRYKKWYMGCREVYLLRNFPVVLDVTPKSNYDSHDELRLLYVGSVNRQRGVIECARYVRRYNKQVESSLRINLTLIGQPTPLVEGLVGEGLVSHCGWLDYPELMGKMTEYDVGICLWHNTKKMARNLPLKNFDYMAAGLPIITSDFGNLAKYAKASGAACMIDPMSYDQFSDAIAELQSIETRKLFGCNGRQYVETTASFEEEAETYVHAVLGESA